MRSKISTDPFLSAWGEVGSWYPVPPRAQALPFLRSELLDWDPATVLHAARAISNSQALRTALMTEMERLVSGLCSPVLRAALASAARSRSGPDFWRRAWLRRALGYAPAIEAERQSWVAALSQLEAWGRALQMTQEGCAGVLAKSVAAVPPELCREDWAALVTQLSLGLGGLGALQSQLHQLIHSARRLLATSALYEDLRRISRESGDVLRSAELAKLLDGS